MDQNEPLPKPKPKAGGGGSAVRRSVSRSAGSRSTPTSRPPAAGSEASPQEPSPAGGAKSRPPAQDLAEKQRQATPRKRGRAKVEEQKAKERAAQQQSLARQASSEGRRSEWSRRASDPRLRNIAIIVLVLCLLAGAVVSAQRFLFAPKLSQASLIKALPPLNNQAARQLGAAAGEPIINPTPDGKYFVLDYLIPSGSKMFNGKNTRKSCRAQIRVDRSSKVTNLEGMVLKNSTVPCRG